MASYFFISIETYSFTLASSYFESGFVKCLYHAL